MYVLTSIHKCSKGVLSGLDHHLILNHELQIKFSFSNCMYELSHCHTQVDYESEYSTKSGFHGFAHRLLTWSTTFDTLCYIKTLTECIHEHSVYRFDF
jgi:hypothetical protein